MKTLFSTALIASLVVNLGLLFAITRGSATDELDDARVATTSSTGAAKTPTAPSTSGIDATVWPALESADLPTLRDRLRACGFPPDVVRAIVRAQIGEMFSARSRALNPDAAERPFWKNVTTDPKILAAERELRREQMKMVRDLLGVDAESDNPYSRAQERRQFGHLSPDKAAEVRDILRTFMDRRSDAMPVGGGTVGPLEREKWATIDREQREAIRAALTPEDFLEYELRNSNTASLLRSELSAFNPSEEEFRKIFALRQPFDDQFNPMMMMGSQSQDDMRRRNEAEKQLREQIKAMLGPERGAIYERASDYNYRRTNDLVARLELPPETTDQLFTIQKEFEQRRTDMMRGGQVRNREEMTEKLTALQSEALAKISPILRTPSAIEAYKQYGGTWFANLVPRPAPTGAK